MKIKNPDNKTCCKAEHNDTERSKKAGAGRGERKKKKNNDGEKKNMLGVEAGSQEFVSKNELPQKGEWA